MTGPGCDGVERGTEATERVFEERAPVQDGPGRASESHEPPKVDRNETVGPREQPAIAGEPSVYDVEPGRRGTAEIDKARKGRAVNDVIDEVRPNAHTADLDEGRKRPVTDGETERVGEVNGVLSPGAGGTGNAACVGLTRNHGDVGNLEGLHA